MTVIRWSLLALLTGSLACGGKDVSGAIDHANGDGDGDNGDGDSGDGDSGDGDDDSGDGDGDSGGGDGDSSGGDGDSSSCQEFSVFAKPTTPDMLIVLDRSSSMTENGRWDASSEAVVSLTQELNEAIHFGLMVFPGTAGAGGGGGGGIAACIPICASDPESAECQDCIDNASTGGGLGDLVCAPGEINVPVCPDTASQIDDVINDP